VQAESPLHRSLQASAAVTQKTQNLNKLFKVEREEVDRGPLWQLVETAKALAYAKSHPKHEHRDSREKHRMQRRPKNLQQKGRVK